MMYINLFSSPLSIYHLCLTFFLSVLFRSIHSYFLFGTFHFVCHRLASNIKKSKKKKKKQHAFVHKEAVESSRQQAAFLRMGERWSRHAHCRIRQCKQRKKSHHPPGLTGPFDNNRALVLSSSRSHALFSRYSFNFRGPG